MNLQALLRDAMKSKNDLARNLLRVILGEVSTRRARTGQEPTDEEVQGIIRKLAASNLETRRELETRGQTTHEAYERLARENVYLDSLLPQTLDAAAITRELEPLEAELKGARSDGQATGLAMKFLKQRGLAVQGDEVASAVKTLRTA